MHHAPRHNQTNSLNAGALGEWSGRPSADLRPAPPPAAISAQPGYHSKWVHPTCHNPNTPPAAFPLVTGPTIRLPGQHGKVRRDGYRVART
jgi:hypothetical protein